MFQSRDYQQYQFNIPNMKHIEGQYWMIMITVYICLEIKKTDPHTLILVKFWPSDEDDEVQLRNLVIRCRNEVAKKVKQVIKKYWEQEDSLVRY